MEGKIQEYAEEGAVGAKNISRWKEVSAYLEWSLLKSCYIVALIGKKGGLCEGRAADIRDMVTTPLARHCSSVPDAIKNSYEPG
jgi:hypothetical protein